MTTPLPTNELARILGGTAQVGEEGVVTVSIPRANTIVLAGIPLKPETGVSVTVAFEPLNQSGTLAAVAPDYALVASEVNPALMESRALGWEIHCLYNQETDEFPQLYFSHNLKTGNLVQLAQEISRVLNRINVKRSLGEYDLSCTRDVIQAPIGILMTTFVNTSASSLERVS